METRSIEYRYDLLNPLILRRLDSNGSATAGSATRGWRATTGSARHSRSRASLHPPSPTATSGARGSTSSWPTSSSPRLQPPASRLPPATRSGRRAITSARSATWWTSASFTLTNHRVFDIFGRLTSETNSAVDSHFAFTGKFFDDLGDTDPTTSLSHHWNRWHDPQLGKWISEDPIGFAGGDANLGRYVGNHATGGRDWSGLFDDPSDIGFGTLPNGRLHVPSDKRGKWTNGVKGNGTFTFDDTDFNRARGVAGLSIDFVDGYIAVGGFPKSIYWDGNREKATVEINEIFGDGRDFDAADSKMRETHGKEWKRPRGYTWNHAGKPGQKVMELVATEVHMAVHHAGNATRSVGRTRPAGPKIRGLVVLDVYLTVRDALDYAGGLPMEGEPLDHCDYTFIDEDGSVFVVQGGWFTKKKFIAGPRIGQVEAITWNEAGEYKRAAEAKWGRWSQWEQRFYPGTHRKRIEAIDPNSGECQGYYDEDGFHRGGPNLNRLS